MGGGTGTTWHLATGHRSSLGPPENRDKMCLARGSVTPGGECPGSAQEEEGAVSAMAEPFNLLMDPRAYGRRWSPSREARRRAGLLGGALGLTDAAEPCCPAWGGRGGPAVGPFAQSWAPCQEFGVGARTGGNWLFVLLLKRWTGSLTQRGDRLEILPPHGPGQLPLPFP